MKRKDRKRYVLVYSTSRDVCTDRQKLISRVSYLLSMWCHSLIIDEENTKENVNYVVSLNVIKTCLLFSTSFFT